MKIIIIGMSGAGKSTLTRALAEITGYPVLHLDRIFHSKFSGDARENLRRAQRAFLAANENCIVDGNYSSSLDERLPLADEILWLKIPRLTALVRVMRRSLANRLFHDRRDMADDFKEKWNVEFLEFLKFVWTFPEKEEPGITLAIEAAEAWDRVRILRNRREVELYLQEVNKFE